MVAGQKGLTSKTDHARRGRNFRVEEVLGQKQCVHTVRTVSNCCRGLGSRAKLLLEPNPLDVALAYPKIPRTQIIGF